MDHTTDSLIFTGADGKLHELSVLWEQPKWEYHVSTVTNIQNAYEEVRDVSAIEGTSFPYLDCPAGWICCNEFLSNEFKIVGHRLAHNETSYVVGEFDDPVFTWDLRVQFDTEEVQITNESPLEISTDSLEIRLKEITPYHSVEFFKYLVTDISSVESSMLVPTVYFGDSVNKLGISQSSFEAGFECDGLFGSLTSTSTYNPYDQLVGFRDDKIENYLNSYDSSCILENLSQDSVSVVCFQTSVLTMEVLLTQNEELELVSIQGTPELTRTYIGYSNAGAVVSPSLDFVFETRNNGTHPILFSYQILSCLTNSGAGFHAVAVEDTLYSKNETTNSTITLFLSNHMDYFGNGTCNVSLTQEFYVVDTFIVSWIGIPLPTTTHIPTQPSTVTTCTSCGVCENMFLNPITMECEEIQVCSENEIYFSSSNICIVIPTTTTHIPVPSETVTHDVDCNEHGEVIDGECVCHPNWYSVAFISPIACSVFIPSSGQSTPYPSETVFPATTTTRWVDRDWTIKIFGIQINLFTVALVSAVTILSLCCCSISACRYSANTPSSSVSAESCSESSRESYEEEILDEESIEVDYTDETD